MMVAWDPDPHLKMEVSSIARSWQFVLLCRNCGTRCKPNYIYIGPNISPLLAAILSNIQVSPKTRHIEPSNFLCRILLEVLWSLPESAAVRQ